MCRSNICHKITVGEMSVVRFWRNVCRRNVLSAKCLSSKCPVGEMSGRRNVCQQNFCRWNDFLRNVLVPYISSWCTVLWWQELLYALIYIGKLLKIQFASSTSLIIKITNIIAENIFLYYRKHFHIHISWWILVNSWSNGLQLTSLRGPQLPSPWQWSLWITRTAF